MLRTPPEFDGYNSWYSHRELAHDRDGLSGLKAPKRTEDQQTTAGTKRKRFQCHEMEFTLDFEGSLGLEQKRARVSVCLEGVSGLSTDEAGAIEDFSGVKDDFMDDDSLDYPACESLSVSSLSTSPGLDTPRTEFSPMDPSFEHMLWEDGGFPDGMDDVTIFSPDLDLLLKKGSPGSVATKDDWVDIFVCADAGHADPIDGNNDATTDLNLDINLDLGYAHLVKLNEMGFAQPPQEVDLGEWDDGEREGFSD